MKEAALYRPGNAAQHGIKLNLIASLLHVGNQRTRVVNFQIEHFVIYIEFAV